LPVANHLQNVGAPTFCSAAACRHFCEDNRASQSLVWATR
jgi:hypothetical protein